MNLELNSIWKYVNRREVATKIEASSSCSQSVGLKEMILECQDEVEEKRSLGMRESKV